MSQSSSEYLLFFIGITGFSTCCSPALAQSGGQQKPNIILIITDQQTASAMSCAGNPYVDTPGMDALAKDGVRFSRAYVSYPLSGPSRASLITGKMPAELGVKDNDDKLSEDDMQSNFGYMASRAGYDCLYAGKWHIPEVNIPENGTGFQKVCDMNDPLLVEKSIPYLQQKRDKPLFFVASFLNPHEICEFARGEALHYGKLEEPALKDCPALPYNFSIPAYYPEAITIHKDVVPKSYPTAKYTEDDWRRYLYAYYRLVERVDNEIVKLINELKKNNLYDNSLILFVSDHGDGVAAHQWNQKRILQEEVVKVPFIVKPPKSKNAGKVNDKALINTSLDIYQTICDYTGVGENKDLHGKSIRPLLENKSETLHENVFVETLLDGVGVRGWTVIGQDYKYTLYRYFKNKEQLVNLDNDPHEMQNLAVDKKYESVLLEKRKKLYEWGVKTNDKLLIRLLKNELQ